MLRRLRPDDAPELLELWNRSAQFDPLSAELLQEKVGEDPGQALVWDDSGLRGFVHAVHRPENCRGYVKLLCVDPATRRRGIATALLEASEKHLGSAGAPVVRVCESNPNYLVPGIDPRYTPALAFCEKRGYSRVGETCNMVCQLGAHNLAAETDPPGLVIRRALPGDKPAVLELLANHFPIWRTEVSTMFQNDPISLHLAFKGGQLAAFAGYDGNNRGTGWFGPMGTSPKHRKLGAGGTLLRRCLQDMQRQGLPSCVIPWVGPYGFYSDQCGATIDRVFWRYEKSLSPA
jgi:mycothiol synthase